MRHKSHAGTEGYTYIVSFKCLKYRHLQYPFIQPLFTIMFFELFCTGPVTQGRRATLKYIKLSPEVKDKAQ